MPPEPPSPALALLNPLHLLPQTDCSAMNIKDIKLAIWSYINVTSVSFNSAVLDFQLTPNNPESNWLW